jgi:hypothetical protein
VVRFTNSRKDQDPGFIASLIAAGTVILCVSLHLAILLFLSRTILPRLKSLRRLLVGIMVLGAIAGHLLEICLFAGDFLLLTQYISLEHIPGGDPFGQYHVVYYSAVTFTSLGGLPVPTGELRLFTAVESLTGLILITWSASFLFLLMQRFWEKDFQ